MTASCGFRNAAVLFQKPANGFVGLIGRGLARDASVKEVEQNARVRYGGSPFERFETIAAVYLIYDVRQNFGVLWQDNDKELLEYE